MLGEEIVRRLVPPNLHHAELVKLPTVQVGRAAIGSVRYFLGLVCFELLTGQR